MNVYTLEENQEFWYRYYKYSKIGFLKNCCLFTSSMILGEFKSELSELKKAVNSWENIRFTDKKSYKSYLGNCYALEKIIIELEV